AFATQTVRIYVDKTCESITGWCRASAAKNWVTFDSGSRWDRFFDPQEGENSLWRKRRLPVISCVVALVVGTLVPQAEPETVVVRLEASDDSSRSVFGIPDAEINLRVE